MKEYSEKPCDIVIKTSGTTIDYDGKTIITKYNAMKIISHSRNLTIKNLIIKHVNNDCHDTSIGIIIYGNTEVKFDNIIIDGFTIGVKIFGSNVKLNFDNLKINGSEIATDITNVDKIKLRSYNLSTTYPQSDIGLKINRSNVLLSNFFINGFKKAIFLEKSSFGAKKGSIIGGIIKSLDSDTYIDFISISNLKFFKIIGGDFLNITNTTLESRNLIITPAIYVNGCKYLNFDKNRILINGKYVGTKPIFLYEKFKRFVSKKCRTDINISETDGNATPSWIAHKFGTGSDLILENDKIILTNTIKKVLIAYILYEIVSEQTLHTFNCNFTVNDISESNVPSLLTISEKTNNEIIFVEQEVDGDNKKKIHYNINGTLIAQNN